MYYFNFLNWKPTFSQQDGCVEFSPPLDETKKTIIECLRCIVDSTHNFPRVEKELFPELKHTKMYLLPVRWEEDHIQGKTNF